MNDYFIHPEARWMMENIVKQFDIYASEYLQTFQTLAEMIKHVLQRSSILFG